MENPIKMGWFGGTIIFGYTHIYIDDERLVKNTRYLRDMQDPRHPSSKTLDDSCFHDPWGLLVAMTATVHITATWKKS